jgi:ribosomal protein S18 acetylase RimI-like enzyme
VTSHPYPLVWPADPAGWLSPEGLGAAWVAVSELSDRTAPESAGGVIGHVCVQHGVTNSMIDSATPGPRSAAVSRLFVAPEARGQGWGAALLAVVVRHCEAEGRRLSLDVVGDDGPAIDLYERLGWRLIDRRTADWSTPAGIQPVLRTYLSPAAAP